MILGTVVGLHRYPVKSMRGEAVAAADLVHTWIKGDRQYAFVRTEDTSSFPWLTARQVPELVLWTAEYDGPDPKTAPVRVTAPDGSTYGIRDAALADRLAAAAGEPVRLLRLGRGAFDAMPLSILSTATVAAVGAAHGAALAAERFRANVLVALSGDAAGEAGWAGWDIGLGGASVAVAGPIPRCAMVGIDPADGSRDPAVVRTVVRAFGNQVGVYCAVRTAGIVAVGDAVMHGGSPCR